MPIYEYECIQCGERFEARQPMGKDGSELTCPQCRNRHPKRLLSSFFNPSLTKSSGASHPTCTTGTCGLPLTYRT